MSLLRQKSAEGGRAALAAFGLPSQPGLGSVGIKTPSAPTLPGLPKPSLPKTPAVGSAGGSSGTGSMDLGAKAASAVGMGASQSTCGAGAQTGEPADTGRRQRSVIDRALQRNDDDFATSSMPLPGDNVAP